MSGQSQSERPSITEFPIGLQTSRKCLGPFLHVVLPQNMVASNMRFGYWLCLKLNIVVGKGISDGMVMVSQFFQFRIYSCYLICKLRDALFSFSTKILQEMGIKFERSKTLRNCDIVPSDLSSTFRSIFVGRGSI